MLKQKHGNYTIKEYPMPKKLFFKLPPEKQQKILDAAAEEFIEYKDNYKKSSVNRIAEKAGIAIGSIYKYFYDKNDLFMCLYNQHKRTPDSAPDSDTFYGYSCKEITLEDQFTPTGKLLLDIINDTPSLFQDLVFTSAEDNEYLNKIRAYIENDSSRGHLRENLDNELAAYMYSSLEFIAYQYRLSNDLSEAEEAEAFRKMTELFFFGLYRDGIEDEIR